MVLEVQGQEKSRDERIHLESCRGYDQHQASLQLQINRVI